MDKNQKEALDRLDEMFQDPRPVKIPAGMLRHLYAIIHVGKFEDSMDEDVFHAVNNIARALEPLNETKNADQDRLAGQ